jgi:hypothetical protein
MDPDQTARITIMLVLSWRGSYVPQPCRQFYVKGFYLISCNHEFLMMDVWALSWRGMLYAAVCYVFTVWLSADGCMRQYTILYFFRVAYCHCPLIRIEGMRQFAKTSYFTLFVSFLKSTNQIFYYKYLIIVCYSFYTWCFVQSMYQLLLCLWIDRTTVYMLNATDHLLSADIKKTGLINYYNSGYEFFAQTEPFFLMFDLIVILFIELFTKCFVYIWHKFFY